MHPDLPGRVDYAHDFTLDPDATDCGGHGTNVTSIAAGVGTSGQDAQGYRYGLGVAPYANVGASKIFRCTGAAAAVNYSQLTSDAYAAGARISNNSWGISNFGGYHVASQAYDALVRDASASTPGNQEMVEVFSAGNDGDGNGNPADPKGDEGYGSISSPGTAKNVITVGAAESVRASGTDGCGVTNAGADNASDIINFSGRGPTQDGRMKPDVVAPGHAHHRRLAAARRLLGRGRLQPGLRRQRVLLARLGHLPGRAAGVGRGRAAARLVRAHGEPAGAVAGHDEGDAREHGHRPRRRRQRQGQPDPARAEHGRGLGPRGRGRRARRHPARVRRPGHGARRGGPELPPLLLGRRHGAPRCGSRSPGPTRRRPPSPATRS